MVQGSEPFLVIIDGLIFLFSTGIALKLSVSLHNQGILEQEMITLVRLTADDPEVQLAQKAALKRASSIRNQKAKIEVNTFPFHTIHT